MYSKEGYRRDSPDKNNPYNIIPSNRISMKDVDHPVLGIDEYGNMQWMMPGEEYTFKGNNVLEIPYMQKGGTIPPDGDIPPNGNPGYTFVESANDPRYIAYQDSLSLYNSNQYKGKISSNDMWSNKDKNDFLSYNTTLYKTIYDKNKIKDYSNISGVGYKIPINDRMYKPVTISYQNLLVNNEYLNANHSRKNVDTYVEKTGKGPTNNNIEIREYSASYPYVFHNTISPIAWLDSPIYAKPEQPIFVKGTQQAIDAEKQIMLKEQGLYTGEIDGDWGPLSKDAWTKYESMQQTKPVEEVKVEQPIKQEPTYQPNNSKFTAIKKSGYTFYDDIDGRKIGDTKYQTPKQDYFEVKFEDGTKQTMSEEHFYKYYGFKKYQQGGTAGMDGMMKARLALDSHFGNPTARRMTNYDTRKYIFPDGNEGNVYVASYDNLVTPLIQDVNGKLTLIEQPWLDSNANRSYDQSMKFESLEDAKYFGENYKKYAPMMNLYQQGGIHINPANKGKFTTQANRANMDVQEYANYVLRNKEDFSPTTVKRANFARNANKWKKQEGGEMNEKIIIKIREALQQGITPEQLIEELQKQGITEQEAIQLVSAAMSQQEEMQQYQYGTTVRHNYADNINFDNKFNATALGLNAVSDPRNMTWALPDTGFGSGLKAISGLASGLAGSYLGYAKLFSDDKIHVQDPKGKPIVSSPYIPEGKDVTKIVKPSSDIPTWDWQTQHPDLTATNMTGKASYTVPNKDNTVNNWYNAPGQNTIGPVEFAKGGMKKYQWAGLKRDQLMNTTSMNQLNPEFLNPEAFNITFNSMYPYFPYLKNTQPSTTAQQEQNKPYNYNENYGRYKQYLDNFAKQDFSQISQQEQNKLKDDSTNKTTAQKKKEKDQIVSMNDDALGFIIANNALIGFQNFNDVLSARDYEKQYNQMLMRTGNSDQRYNPINPTNPYGMYTPNAGIGSNYGLVANSHIQDFGTSMASAKCGGMKKKYKEGGEYNLTQEEIDYILKNGGEIEILD